MLIIANNEPLGAEWVDHTLSGNQWKNYRELHVGCDFLLIYRIEAIRIFIKKLFLMNK